MSSEVSPAVRVALALETSPFGLRPLEVSAAPTLGSERFDGVAFWNPDLSAADSACKILLAPGGLTPSDHEPLSRVLMEGGAAALVVPPSSTALVKGWPDVAQRTVVLDPQYDWSDMASLLRALCAPAMSASTAVVEQGNLFSLAQSLASLAGGAISIADTMGRILGYSTHADQPIDETRRQSTLTLREASDPAVSEDYQALFRSAHSLWFPRKGADMGRAALPVRAGSEMLGIVWLIADTEDEGGSGCQFLDSVAGLIAHHMVLARESTNFSAQRSSDLLRTVLENPSFRTGAMSELGMKPGRSYRAVAFTAAGPQTDNPVLHAQRQLHHIWLTARSMFSWSEAAILGDHMVCLTRDTSEAVAAQFANRVVSSSNLKLVAGIGRGSTQATSIALSIKEAMAITQILRDGGPAEASVAYIDAMRERVGLKRLVEHLPDTGMLEGDPIDRLLRIDAEQGSDLARTLYVYLTMLGSIARAASELNVHENTVRYRLDHLQKAAGLSLSNAHSRLWVWLRLYAEFEAS